MRRKHVLISAYYAEKNMYIHEQQDWPRFRWDYKKLSDLLSEVSFLRGKLLGTMKSLGFSFQQEAILQNMTAEIVKSSEIEGVLLNMEQVGQLLPEN